MPTGKQRMGSLVPYCLEWMLRQGSQGGQAVGSRCPAWSKRQCPECRYSIATLPDPAEQRCQDWETPRSINPTIACGAQSRRFVPA